MEHPTFRHWSDLSVHSAEHTIAVLEELRLPVAAEKLRVLLAEHVLTVAKF